MAEKYKIHIEGADDRQLDGGIACRGFALIAFDSEMGDGEHGDAVVIIMESSTDDIKKAIMHSPPLIQAAVLAKGELEAHRLRMDVEVKDGLAKRLKGLIENV